MTKADKEGQRKTPILRFKGFTDYWEQREFIQILKAKDGIKRGPFGSALKKEYFIPYGNYAVYEQRNAIYNSFNTRYYITQNKFEELKKFELVPGDIIMSGAGTIGRLAMIPSNSKPGVFNQALIRFRVNEQNDNLFFLYFMRTPKLQKKLTNVNPGSAMVNLVPIKEIKKWECLFPYKREQKRIVSLLSKMDSILTLYERKTKLIKQIQSSFLDKFFSEPNNVTSLNHFLRIRNGYAFRSSELTENGEIPVVKISNIGNDKSFAFTTKEKNKEQFALYPNDIVIALSGATAGKINQISNKYPLYYQNQRVGFFERKNDKLDYEYLNSFLHSKKFKSQLQKTLVAGAQPNIAPKDIEKIKIPFIEYKLQQKIGQVNKYLFELQKIDKSKLTLLDKIKKTLLNNMFV